MANLPLYFPTNPHFLQPLLPGFTNHLDIPVAFFLKHLDGSNKDKTAELRTDASEITWNVKVDSRRFTDGWEDFAVSHDLRVGDIVVFRHEGDLVFYVSPLGPSCCEIQYEDRQDNDKMEKVERSKFPEIEVNSSLDHPCFVVAVTASNLKSDIVYLPKNFAMSNGLMKKLEIDLMNEEGVSWRIESRHEAYSGRFYMRGGWRSFCVANGKKPGDLFTCKLLTNEETPVLQMFPMKYLPKLGFAVDTEDAPRKKSRELEADSSPDHSCVLVAVTASNLKRDVVYLPKMFATSNGLMKKLEIVLVNEEGGSWRIESRHETYSGRFYMRGGWRSFCISNGKKPGDFFKFKLVRNEETPVLQQQPLNSEDLDGERKIKKQNVDFSSVEPSNGTRQRVGATKKENVSTESNSKQVNSSTSQDRFVTLTFTPTRRLNLPMEFTKGNGINKAGKITMVDRYGARWSTSLLMNKKISGTMSLGKGWRGFCEVNGVNMDESFLLELIWEDTVPVLKFCSKC